MKYLLDTDAVIHLIRSEEKLTDRVFSLSPRDFAISGFTEAELIFGIENSGPSHRRARNSMVVQLALAPLQTLYQNQSVSWCYGKIKAHLASRQSNNTQKEVDLFIAATAIAYDLILITQNPKDLKSIPGLMFEDWS